MRPSLALVGLCGMLLGSTVADFWNTKTVTDWTHQDSEQMMAHSPWAKQQPLPGSERPHVSYVDGEPAINPSAPPTAELGNVTIPKTAATGSGRTPSITPGPVGSPEIQPYLKIVWASALPVRLAVMRLKLTPTEPTEEQIAHVEKEWPNYVIAVVGLAPPDNPAQAKQMAGSAFLSVPGKPAVVAIDSDYRRIGHSDVYFFRFAKASFPIALSDREAEFRLKEGSMNLKQKFELSNMLFQGRLAL